MLHHQLHLEDFLPHFHLYLQGLQVYFQHLILHHHLKKIKVKL